MKCYWNPTEISFKSWNFNWNLEITLKFYNPNNYIRIIYYWNIPLKCWNRIFNRIPLNSWDLIEIPLISWNLMEILKSHWILKAYWNLIEIIESHWNPIEISKYFNLFSKRVFKTYKMCESSKYFKGHFTRFSTNYILRRR